MADEFGKVETVGSVAGEDPPRNRMMLDPETASQRDKSFQEHRRAFSELLDAYRDEHGRVDFAAMSPVERFMVGAAAVPLGLAASGEVDPVDQPLITSQIPQPEHGMTVEPLPPLKTMSEMMRDVFQIPGEAAMFGDIEVGAYSDRPALPETAELTSARHVGIGALAAVDVVGSRGD